MVTLWTLFYVQQGKAWFKYDKRLSSKSINGCETCPESENTTFLTDKESAHTAKRLENECS